MRTHIAEPRNTIATRQKIATSSVHPKLLLRTYRVKNCRNTQPHMTQKIASVSQSSMPWPERSIGISTSSKVLAISSLEIGV
jgi:hypothetical protein